MSSPDLCFVYGTLRRGFGNHRIMQRAGGRFFGDAVTRTPFPLVVDGLPYLLERPGEGFPVEGELYRIPEYGWEDLDRLEGHPHFYRRRVESFLVGGEVVQAWVYFLSRDDGYLSQLNPMVSFAATRTVSA